MTALDIVLYAIYCDSSSGSLPVLRIDWVRAGLTTDTTIFFRYPAPSLLPCFSVASFTLLIHSLVISHTLHISTCNKPFIFAGVFSSINNNNKNNNSNNNNNNNNNNCNNNRSFYHNFSNRRLKVFQKVSNDDYFSTAKQVVKCGKYRQTRLMLAIGTTTNARA